jgi:hypothetical protein
MLDRDVGLAQPAPEEATDVPATRIVRVEYEGTVNQRNDGGDILAEIGQRKGGIRPDARIVASRFQGSPCEIGTLPAIRPRIFA